MNIKKYVVALFLLIPLIASATDMPPTASANDSPKVMYDFMPYLGAKAPDWVRNLNKREAESNKVVKTIDYKELNSDIDYRYTLFDDILYSVEVRIGSYNKPRWSIEDKYEKLGIATGIADSLKANGFTMTSNKNDKKVRYFEKSEVFVALENYQTQYRKDSTESSILVTFTNPKFIETVKKRSQDIISRLAIEHKDMYKDLVGQ